MTRPRFHLAVPVDDLVAAAHFYGEVLGCPRGREADTWVDWNLHGHQLVTHLDTSGRDRVAVRNEVDADHVPVPHFGLILDIESFHTLSRRLADHRWPLEIEPHVRFAGEAGEQWTMFVLDPAGNALEFKAFADDAQVFRRS
ncbi:MAG: VOC family protein [Acidimicrobiia bacterium]